MGGGKRSAIESLVESIDRHICGYREGFEQAQKDAWLVAFMTIGTILIIGLYLSAIS